MSSNWPYVNLAEICSESAFGPRFSGEQYSLHGNVATLRTTDISEAGRIEYSTMPLAQLDITKFQQHLLQKNDLVITRSGRVGTAAIFDGFRLPVIPGAFLIRFRLNSKKADPYFYRYYFNSNEGHSLLISVATGSVQQNLNITSLNSLMIPLPPLTEQHSIALFVNALDKKIDLNRQMSKTLEAICKAIFRHWFIDFEFPNEEGKPYKSSGGQMAYNEELGKEIPKDWRTVTLEQVCEFAYGKPLTEHSRKPGLVPVYGSNGRVGWHEKALVEGPGIVIGRKGNPGVVTWVQSDFFPVDTTFYVLSKNQINSLHYIFYAISMLDLSRFASDSAVPGLNRNIAYSSIILAPEPTVLKSFDTTMDGITRKVESNSKESITLAEVRDILLPKLMSGKIRVPVGTR